MHAPHPKLKQPHQSFLGLGANIEEPKTQIATAIQTLSNHEHIEVVKVSSLYESEAIGPPQPNFINAVAEINTHVSAETLLALLQAIELEQGRKREQHWGPRTLDIDILLFDQVQLTSRHLTIPHPEMKHRAFVIKPLIEIAPKLKLPCGTTLESIEARLQPTYLKKLER